MPARIPKACRKRGCPKTTTDRSGYCDNHKGDGWNSYQQGKSRHERGYGSSWDRLKPIVMKRDRYLCQNCLRNDIVISGTTVDHIIPKARGGSDELCNLELLCVPCHRRKTARERIK
ncbi:HNH endonuclease [Limnobaculum zhutongyuii]|uniref:Putative HNH nuclease YajD n=1 Tax=Limnobaculum zhutongyuii TaxID=2498113 RepID=A0A411WQF4_9GAMM|nr:HNH endonuclease signature motif containing protein [Limnobaculum zhutongyuii]QBH98422.1 HNH endonuclease [Limnobaculum zhutongyuii]TQS89680.1 HNH endonuclease [Limnobaculum zhutongyuii]